MEYIMKVFITGASGFIGSALVKELLTAGHQVLALARSADAARRMIAIGAMVRNGTLDELEILRDGASQSDAVVHLAFGSDYAKFAETCDADVRAIKTIGAAISGTSKPFIVPNGLAGIAPGRVVTEDDVLPSDYTFPRRSEQVALGLARETVNAMVIRLAQVHDTARQGLVTPLIALARHTGVSAYVDDGANRWPAVHISDAVRLFRLVLESPRQGGIFHAVAESGVTLHLIAESIGKATGTTMASLAGEDAQRHFGPFAQFVAQDMPATSARTRVELNWQPVGPGLIHDLGHLVSQ